MRRLFATIGVVGLMLGGIATPAEAQTTQAGPADCDVCEQHYNEQIGQWTHAFPHLGGGAYPFSHCFEGPWPDGACHPTYYTHLCSFSHNYCDEYSSNVAELTVALESGNDQLLSRLLEAKSGVRRVSEFEYEIDVCDKDYVGRLVNGKEVGIVLRQRPVEALLAIE